MHPNFLSFEIVLTAIRFSSVVSKVIGCMTQCPNNFHCFVPYWVERG